MIQKYSSGLDDFINQHISYTDVDASINNSISVLPQRVKDSVMLDINKDNFSALSVLFHLYFLKVPSLPSSLHLL